MLNIFWRFFNTHICLILFNSHIGFSWWDRLFTLYWKTLFYCRSCYIINSECLTKLRCFENINYHKLFQKYSEFKSSTFCRKFGSSKSIEAKMFYSWTTQRQLWYHLGIFPSSHFSYVFLILWRHITCLILFFFF